MADEPQGPSAVPVQPVALDRILVTVEADDRVIAAEARATDAALAGRLRDNELLRAVARIERLIAKKERP